MCSCDYRVYSVTDEQLKLFGQCRREMKRCSTELRAAIKVHGKVVEVGQYTIVTADVFSLQICVFSRIEIAVR